MDLRISLLLLTSTLGVLLPPVESAAQTSAADRADWVMPRTPEGHPDLQGTWSNGTLTPIQRPADRPNLILTWDEVAEIEGNMSARLEDGLAAIDPENRPELRGTADLAQAYDEFFWDRGDRVAVIAGEPRSSLITWPANGRVPPLSPEGERRRDELQAFRSQFDQYDHPELRPLAERCLMSFGSNAGPPMLPNGAYNNNYRIVQTADYILIVTEMIHDARIIRLGSRPRMPADIRPWMGDSHGWWDGDVLVVETTNINPQQVLLGMEPSGERRVIERFARTDEGTILYEFTVHDPLVYSEPWGGEVPFYALDELMYEYACHEGNYALEAVLSGGRFEEQQRREAEGR